MSAKVILIVFAVVSLSGCAMKSGKHDIQPQSAVPAQTYHQDPYPWNNDYSRIPDDNQRASWGTSSVSGTHLSSKQIQRALQNAGYYKGAIDGKVGPKTKAAIVQFQRSNGLKADGIVGKKTVTALKKYLP